MRNVFSPKDVAAIVGISYRQIQYWDSSGFIRPSIRRRGRYRGYTFQDLILLKIASDLRARGMSIQRLRKVIASVARLIERLDRGLDDLTLLLEGESILVFTGDVVMDRGSEQSFFEFRVPELRARIVEVLGDEDDELGLSTPREQLG